jgi:hypothetical protein
MKTSKLFTIDLDIAERLKGLNASHLVNSLLSEHFSVNLIGNKIKNTKETVAKSLKKNSNWLKRSLKLLKNLKILG